MINLSDAFSSDTTAAVRYYKLLEGAYDDDNYWVAGGYEDPIEILATPMPFGDRDAGIAGIELKARTTGERKPAFMKFTTIEKININDRMEVYGITYKIVKHLKHRASGFNIVVGSTILEDSH